MSLVTIGLDPDLHATGIAWCTLEKVQRVAVARVSAKLKGEEAVIAMSEAIRRVLGFSFDRAVVEGQEIYLRHTKNPDSILRIGQVAGCALGLMTEDLTPSSIRLPRPKEWKGSVPKEIMAARIMRHYGMTVKNRSSIPGSLGITNKEWGHVTDAIGLALWGCRQESKK